MENKWKELLEYIAQNNFTESVFSSPRPQINIEVIGLLNKIAELRGISYIENGEEFNSICDNLEKSN